MNNEKQARLQSHLKLTTYHIDRMKGINYRQKQNIACFWRCARTVSIENFVPEMKKQQPSPTNSVRAEF